MKKQFFALLLALMLAALCAVPAMAETINYTNGDKYVGEVVNGKPNGIGTYTTSGGQVYHGEMVDGYFEGTGVYTWPSGSIYAGEFKKDLFEGKGVLVDADGYVYIGEFSGDKRHGIGSIYTPEGTLALTGVFENGELVQELTASSAAPAETPASSASAADSFIGEWVCSAVKIGEMSISAEAAGLDVRLSINADGSCTLSYDGDSATDKWTLDGDHIVVDGGNLYLNGDELHMVEEDGTIVFVRAQ